MLGVEHSGGNVMMAIYKPIVDSYGRIIATGAPDEIGASAEVREAYLGEDHPAHARV